MPTTRLLLAAALLATAAACGGAPSPAAQPGEPPAGQGVTVAVHPARVTVLPGATVSFTSQVTGTADPSVTWEVVEPNGGTVSKTGTYVAPLTSGEYTVSATSQASPSSRGKGRVKVSPILVTITPGAPTVAAGGTVAFAATVKGTTNTAVTWSVKEPSGCGSIAASGAYTAPAVGATCHADATSVADPSITAEATVTVTPPPPVVVAIAPASGAVDACRTLTFTASVTGTTNGAVTWSVQEGTAGGTISPAGVYTAPAQAGTYHVVATSQAAPTSSVTAAVTVAERILGVAVSPSTLSLAPGATGQFTATVTSTCGAVSAKQTVTAPN